ncbi:coatomer subunit delta [Acrasis kona]|uniref:Coatomer subunit delta n=1 Tax=Acrasis kona TaxID=1008807 RepID=A0AAW2ZKF5_9EUKA
MVILAASICTKSGKALVSRQFRDISRIRIEGLLSAFPKLMNPKSQHTFVETDSVRYVYQPLESLFLLLITTKSSNIVEDLDTLQLLSLTVKDQCQNATTEDVVVDKAFEIMFAFDEVVSLGFKEKVNLDNVRTILEMESHAEEVYNINRENNIAAAKAISKQKAVSMINPENKKTGISKKDFIGGGPSSFENNTPSYTKTESRYTGSGSGGFGSSSGASSSSSSYSSAPSSDTSSKQAHVPRMKLAPKSKQPSNALVKELIKQGEVQPEEQQPTGPTQSNPTTPNINRQESYQESVHVVIEEKIRAEVDQEGGNAKIDVRGELFLSVKEGANANIKLQVSKNRAPDSQFATKLNPMLDKKAFSDDSILCLKNAKKSFPSGPDLHKIFTWRHQNSEDEGVLPLTVSCWPNASSDGTTVSVEYELTRKDMELNDLVIRIPVPPQDRNARVTVDTIEQGTYKYDQKASELVWTLDTIDADNNGTGALEFAVPNGGDRSAFFPIQVQFGSRSTLSRIAVDSVVSVEGNERIKHSSDTRLTVSEYSIV